MVDDDDPDNGQIPSRRPEHKDPRGLTSDYSKIASRYDATRDLPEEKLIACYDRLVERGLFPAHGKVLDAGCGTGQVSLSLAARGYDVRGIDISKEMTMLARAKVSSAWRADYSVGDARNIPADDDSFDAAVVSKLFQHVQDWHQVCRELIRVVRPGSYIVQINERGAFGNSVRRHFSLKADEFGFNGRYAGLRPNSPGELSAFMASQGCRPAPVDMSDLRWDVTISNGEALSRIREGLFAEFWRLPPEVHHRLIADTLSWIETLPDGLNTVDRLNPYLVVEVFQTPELC
jgi:ubiquinone/menaquinone biosynthesis C-methylase UbiE